MFFANSLGLMLLTRSKESSNFARDFKSYDEVAPVPKKEIKEEKEISKPETFEKQEKEPPPFEAGNQVATEGIMTYSQSNISQIFSRKVIFMVITILVALLVMTGLFLVLRNGVTNINFPFISSPTATPTITPAPTITPTPTIDNKLKRSDLRISVENGTDKIGFAKETAVYLEGLGYKILSKSNADKDDYEKTIIMITETKKNYLPLVISDLRDKFDTSSVESLDKDSKYDIVLILGKK